MENVLGQDGDLKIEAMPLSRNVYYIWHRRCYLHSAELSAQWFMFFWYDLY